MTSLIPNDSRFHLSVAMSIFVIAAIAGHVEAAGGLAFNIATEVMMEDAFAEMMIASAQSGTNAVISTNDGQTTLTPDGDQFFVSFTAGSVILNDQATFMPSEGATGTGTWSILTIDGSTVNSMGTATVTYDASTSTYNMALNYTFANSYIPGIGTVNGFQVTNSFVATLQGYTCNDKGHFINERGPTGPTRPTHDILDTAGTNAGLWQQVGDDGQIAGDAFSYQNGFDSSPPINSIGDFSGSTVAAVPEPSSIVLLGLGSAVMLVACGKISRADARPESPGRKKS